MDSDNEEMKDFDDNNVDIDGEPHHSRKTGRFSKAQNVLIESYFPEWHELSLVKYPNTGGRGTNTELTRWKKRTASQILKDPAFTQLPDGVSKL
jgi:hypothetical protein